MVNIRFVGFPPSNEDELIGRLKNTEIPPEELAYSFDCSEVKNMHNKLCPYIEIRAATDDKKGKIETNQIIEEFSEFDIEVTPVTYRRGNKIVKKNKEIGSYQ